MLTDTGLTSATTPARVIVDPETEQDLYLPPRAPSLFSPIFNLLHESLFLSLPAVRDALKLILVGGAVEMARRLIWRAWDEAWRAITITAHIPDSAQSYDHMIAWLSSRTSFSSDAREFSLRPAQGRRPPGIMMRSLRGSDDVRMGDYSDLEEGEYEEIAPWYDQTQKVQFEGKTIYVTRTQKKWDMGDPSEDLTIITDFLYSVFARSQDIIHRLLAEARREYKLQDMGNLAIWTVDSSNCQFWRHSTSRTKRPLSSIILPSGVKEGLLKDVTDFMKAKRWYAERGIPHRRGYLLHGKPGSGKTSLISALAGELGLEIAVVNLSLKGLDDTALDNLMSTCPARSVLLMEDIDSAFKSRTGGPGDDAKAADRGDAAAGVTFSGLLNAIDGVQASEGRLIFATTNHVELIDEALARPGRTDVWVEFTHANKQQARDLFLHFYPPSETCSEKTPVLAEAFAAVVPEYELSVAALQGYLMGFKSDPAGAVAGFADWKAQGAGRRTLVDRGLHPVLRDD